ncbi:neurensin 1-like [Lampris incognitus]|uniref:neurensin 1-like n=1 Tax=Lampris incognitus TaxID=2546036 RepID=UPI0024B5EAE4|nr:neurensin 1-like [Lampris incognitus]
MALCSEACVSGGESSGSETGSSCLQFGVRSYLHHFYEECSSSMWERGHEDQGFVQAQRSPRRWSSGLWKVSLALGLLILTAGIASMSVSYSTPRRIESFGEGDLLFVDAQAVSFNQGLHVSGTAGIGLSCLGSGLAMVGAVLWLLPKVRLLQREEVRDKREEWGREGGGGRGPDRSIITRAPGTVDGKLPVTLSKVESVQPAP